MPQATIDQQKLLGLTPPPPGVPEVDPKIKVKLAKVDPKTYRKLLKLTDAQKTRIKKVMKEACREWYQNTRRQNQKLLRNIDRLEGISAPKNFPWPESSNLNIPYTEIQILVAADIVAETVIDADPTYFIKELLPARKDHPEEHVDPNIEAWLKWVFKKQLKLDDEERMSIYLAFRDPVAYTVQDWVEEIGREYSVQVFDSTDGLKNRFPDPDSAGVSPEIYQGWLSQLALSLEPIALEIEEDVVQYRGPKIRVVELKDFVRIPVNAPDLKYCLFYGDQFRQRKNYFRKMMDEDSFYEDETKKLLDSTPKNKSIDDISQRLDIVEGIEGTRLNPDEYDCVRGNLRIDINDDGDERLYHVVYNPEGDYLLRVEKYPYWHNRPNYTPWRIRKKPNRLLGRCFTDMLFDINEEINTQHNQRIDSRTITTVPSFKVAASETDLLSLLDRKQQGFFPGVRFALQNIKNMEQLDTKVDFQGTLQEEQNLMQIGEMLTGTGAGGARANPQRDPRASGKKLQQLIGQSNKRIDGYIRELKPSFQEVASQVMELYYQFSPNTPIEYATYDQASETWIRGEIERTALRNRNMTIEIARSTVMDNADAILQRALTAYQIWKDEPLVGGNLLRRHELIRDVMFNSRQKNISKLLPPLQQNLKEMAGQDQLAGGSPSQRNLLSKVQGNDNSDEASGTREGGPDLSVGRLNRSQPG